MQRWILMKIQNPAMILKIDSNYRGTPPWKSKKQNPQHSQRDNSPEAGSSMLLKFPLGTTKGNPNEARRPILLLQILNLISGPALEINEAAGRSVRLGGGVGGYFQFCWLLSKGPPGRCKQIHGTVDVCGIGSSGPGFTFCSDCTRSRNRAARSRYTQIWITPSNHTKPCLNW